MWFFLEGRREGRTTDISYMCSVRGPWFGRISKKDVLDLRVSEQEGVALTFALLFLCGFFWRAKGRGELQVSVICVVRVDLGLAENQ